ncbi:phosphate transport system regulatory protein PhoU [candidate division WOR-1 bacterium RIFCSPHIGHO2_01_FULL_53_15]|uniref:Phosphate-specific transport system accessory protein PhoU n=1 Tax=candidate division WOR-1 bacterium RIFCSPHIGHO2_01_FULL_53_15 TaxID=1802564 RepID=A0A1F4Q3J7_UNCSA|nr:MAG: phosphate transport system regulatory protein PhoU [candidate division WOR-1 bacterium RIFCSPHIGHO2_01_FULL_53_15]OGC13059.1 MAG: phosphate transport system regulatory protein PhoU [candidate division WOR-1 bacterium RIFCSPHIGHO2_02_FULL_53_26]
MIEQREHFQKELAKLNDLILKMGGMVEKSIFNSVEALKKSDAKMADQVIKLDDGIDKLELEIDELCLELLATQQPMAIDLRFITTGMRIASDIERIGDLAVDIALRAFELSKQPLLKPLEDIPKMAELAEKMVHRALDSFVKRDAAMARGLWADEEKADGYRDLIHDELVGIMTKDPSTISRALPLILIARHLERIADHTTNIGEDVVYMVEGKVIKHAPK